MAARVFRQLMKTVLMSTSFLAMCKLSSAQLAVYKDLSEEPCPPCENVFRQLEKNEETGKLSKVVRLQERGEPKSGTGFMFEWATAAVIQTCNYLNRLFGEGSCQVKFHLRPENDGHDVARPITRKMVFEPALGASTARCPCETIESVSIVLSKEDKHTLPVREDCAFRHRRGVATVAPGKDKGLPKKTACTFSDGSAPNGNDDIWRCMHEANCGITDDWLQMVVFRDPRPTVVSAYFYLEKHSKKNFGELPDFVAQQLPLLCQFIAVRHILFTGLLAHQSVEFWYDDAIAEPLHWHYQFLDAVGLQLPYHLVEAISAAAAANDLDDLGFRHKPKDKHPGAEPMNDTGVRQFEDEVTPDVLEAANAVLRVWLPAVLLERLGIPPEGEEV